ncbi:extracellular solute-binding protein [Paenibacillus sp. OAS669]|uniref:extracellular solute-binding protein n=1 Tax=Paenibacillus sp. OAS669 TaxID=2663821 RepID=UPI0017894725|nr:extracellular solute-binding protein [Paenibacillus sp. OAS669]MBE1440899.1 putative aldouronate transport system substrate-binding protein [Paenibacillus sp. OAS669]
MIIKARWFGISASALLLAGLLSACSSKDAANGEGAGSAASKDPVTLKVEVFDRGNAPAGAGPVNNNFWTQWIQKNFGDPNNIKLEFIPVPRNQETEKLNVLMATGDAPDIVFAYDMNTVNNYVKSGGLAEVGKLIDEHGPNLKKYLGQEVLSYGVFSGKQYTIPAKRTLQYTQSSYIRKDWLDKLGLPVPTTTEQFYNTMKAFKEKDPGNTGGKVIPFGFSALGGSGINTPIVLASAFVKNMPEEDFYAFSTTRPVLELMKPGFKDGVQFLNKMNQEGLIDSDFALDKDGKVFEKNVANGLIGAFTAVAAHPTLMGPGNLFDTLKKNVPGAQYVAMDPFTNEEGKHPKNIYGPSGMHIMIPKSSKHAVEAIKYLDWMSQEDVLFTLTNGIEGQHYTLENGFPKAITTDEAKKTFYNNVDIAIIVNGKDYGTLEKNIEATALAFPDYKEMAKQSILNALKDGYTEPRFERPIDAENKYNKTLVDKSQEAIVKSILAKLEDFSKTYDSLAQEYLKLGGQAVIDERRAAYKEMQKK